jgi:high frequency lysogenization protein
MSRHDERDRTLALAGVFQAAHLVAKLARNGLCDRQAATASRDSLFEFDPASVEAVFGGLAGVELGLRTLLGQLDQPAQRDLEVARYVIALVQHADKLLSDRQRFEALGRELEILKQKSSNYDLGEFSRSAQLARVYQEHISPVQPQIMVRGEPLYLQNPQIAGEIRSLLLAGVRAGVLWRQCGGKRWHLLIRRRRITELAAALLDAIV